MCPLCGAELEVTMHDAYDGIYLFCKNYPKCKYKEDLEALDLPAKDIR